MSPDPVAPDSAEWKSIWSKVAEELSRYRVDGLSHLITEDVLRFAAIQMLARANVDPGSLRIEYPHPAIRGGKVDLAIGLPPSDVIEFKYPREPTEKNAAWTMVLGEVLKDFYRLAIIKGQVRRQMVLVTTDRLRRFLESSAERHGLTLSPERVELVPEVIAALPATAVRILSDLQAYHVKAAGTTYIIDENLRPISYLVSPIGE